MKSAQQLATLSWKTLCLQERVPICVTFAYYVLFPISILSLDYSRVTNKHPPCLLIFEFFPPMTFLFQSPLASSNF